jgi:hypothetical protein
MNVHFTSWTFGLESSKYADEVRMARAKSSFGSSELIT